MKQIELTKEHRSKLLEMCKCLFINYSDIIFSTDYDQFEDTTEEDNPNILIFYQGSGKRGIAIHWFEFCMTHLVYKLLNKDKYEALNLHSENYHLIDYLYEEFKKLNNN